MNVYDLPTSLTIGGVGYPIRYGWRHVVRILTACADTNISDRAKRMIVLKIMYPDWKQIPGKDIPEALKKANDFIDCGQQGDGSSKPKTIDWKQDAHLIIPEVNKVAQREVRIDPDIHWWTFFGWFMGIGEGTLGTVLHIRQQRSKGKKLEKWERDFYIENRSIVDFVSTDAAEIRAEKDNILKYL